MIGKEFSLPYLLTFDESFLKSLLSDKYPTENVSVRKFCGKGTHKVGMLY